MAKEINRRFKIRFPQFFGLPEREDGYVFKETIRGYTCIIQDGEYLGHTKKLIENNPEIYEEVERGNPFRNWVHTIVKIN